MTDETNVSEEEKIYTQSAEEDNSPEPEDQNAAANDEQPQPTQQDAPQGQQEPAVVPHGAFHAEREKRKAYQKEAEEAARKMAEMESRFNQVMERLNSQPVPDFEEDPAGYLRYSSEQTAKELAALKQQQQQQLQQQQMQAEQQRLVTAVATFESEFRARQPDYEKAIDFARTARDKELEVLGYYDPDERQRIIAGEIQTIVRTNLQVGRNPAEAFYNFAVARGYQRPNNIEALNAGQKGTNPMSGGGGNGKQNPPSLEALSQMTDEEFEKNFSKLWANT